LRKGRCGYVTSGIAALRGRSRASYRGRIGPAGPWGRNELGWDVCGPSTTQRSELRAITSRRYALAQRCCGCCRWCIVNLTVVVLGGCYDLLSWGRSRAHIIAFALLPCLRPRTMLNVHSALAISWQPLQILWSESAITIFLTCPVVHIYYCQTKKKYSVPQLQLGCLVAYQWILYARYQDSDH